MFQEELVILLSVLIIMVLAAIVIVLFVVFVRQKNHLLLEQEKIKIKFNNELAKTQIEIREATLRNISWELHDNIGQLMTLAKIHAQESLENTDKTEDVIDILDKGIKELRALSRSINPEYIKQLNLVEAVQVEIARFNRLEFIEANLEIQGEQRPIDSKNEIIIFRILQEIFSNTIKHSKGKNLGITMDYQTDQLVISIKDNGVGFDTDKDFEGIGLKNIKSRAKIIGLDLSYKSELNQGTQFILVYLFKSHE